MSNFAKDLANKIRYLSGKNDTSSEPDLSATASTKPKSTKNDSAEKQKSKQTTLGRGRKKKPDSQQLPRRDSASTGNIREATAATGGGESEPDGDNWVCAVCNLTFTDDDCKLIECDKCTKRFCLACIGMNEAVYEYMCKDDVLWCCGTCCREVRTILEAQKQSISTQDDGHDGGEDPQNRDPFVTNMRKDLDSTINAMKMLIQDFHGFIHGSKQNERHTRASETNQDDDETKVKLVDNEEGHRSNQNGPWKTVDNQKKSFREILKEANEESRREGEEELKRKKNIIIHRLPELDSETWADRKGYDGQTIKHLMDTLEVEPKVEGFQRLGRRPRPASDGEQLRQSQRPLKVTLQSEEDVKMVLKNLGKLREADTLLNNIRVAPDMNLKEREKQRELVEQAKNLTRQESGDFIHIVRGKAIIRVKSKRPRRSEHRSSGQHQVEQEARPTTTQNAPQNQESQSTSWLETETTEAL